MHFTESHHPTIAAVALAAGVALIGSFGASDMSKAGSVVDDGKTVTITPRARPRAHSPADEARAKPRMPQLTDICDFPGHLPPHIARDCREKRKRRAK